MKIVAWTGRGPPEEKGDRDDDNALLLPRHQVRNSAHGRRHHGRRAARLHLRVAPASELLADARAGRGGGGGLPSSGSTKNLNIPKLDLSSDQIKNKLGTALKDKAS